MGNLLLCDNNAVDFFFRMKCLVLQVKNIHLMIRKELSIILIVFLQAFGTCWFHEFCMRSTASQQKKSAGYWSLSSFIYVKCAQLMFFADIGCN